MGQEQAKVGEQDRVRAQELAKMQLDFEERQRQAEADAQRQIKELEAKAQKAAAEEDEHRQREANMRKLEDQLMIAMPLVKEANLIAKELKRSHRIETKMQVSLSGDRGRGSLSLCAAVSYNQ